MKTRYWFIVAMLLAGAATAGSQQPAEPATSRVPAAAVKPCPQHALHPVRPAEQGMPCTAMRGAMMGQPGMPPGPGPRARQAAPAATTGKSASSGAQQVYGWQLMTQDERMAFQARMRAAKTEAERAALRAENHKKMQERAKQQGVTLPEVPPGS